MPEKLRGTVAIVTGASSEIGHASALALAAEGATVTITARRQERMEALVSEIKALNRKKGHFMFKFPPKLQEIRLNKLPIYKVTRSVFSQKI